MSLRKSFKTDTVKEISGVEVPVGVSEVNGETISFTVSRMSSSNKVYTQALQAATRPHKASIQNETLDREVSDSIFKKVFVRTVLKGWKNVFLYDLTGEDADMKTPLEFNEENALALFKELPDVYETIESAASSAATFRQVEREKDAKN